MHSPSNINSSRKKLLLNGNTITAHDLQVSILEVGYIIPVDVVLKHFSKADEDKSGDLTREELSDYLVHVSTSRCEVLDLLKEDTHFWKGVGYTVAGLLLVVVAFFGDLMSSKESLYVDLVASLLYATISFYFVVTFPLNLFRKERAIQKNLFALRDAVVENTRKYAENDLPPDLEIAMVPYTSARDELIHYLSDLYVSTGEKDALIREEFEEMVLQKFSELKEVTLRDRTSLERLEAVEADHENLSSEPFPQQLAAYISHHVFGEKTAMTERDLELWVLNELRLNCSDAFINYVFRSADVIGDHVIAPDGVHCLILKLMLREAYGKHCLKETVYSIFMMKGEIAWIMSVLFFCAYVIKSLKNIWYLVYYEKLKFGSLSASELAAWLKIVGTMEYVVIAVQEKTEEYDELARAKAVLSHFLYQLEIDNGRLTRNAKLLGAFRGNGLSKVGLRELFDVSSIHLPGHVFDHIYHDIDDDHNGIISKQELQDYVRRPANRPLDITISCLKSLHFWSSCSLLLGSFFFLGDVYVINETSESITMKLGSILHFVGGLVIAYGAYEHQSEFVEYARRIVEVMAVIGDPDKLDNQYESDHHDYSFHTAGDDHDDDCLDSTESSHYA
mmetsp:Transcript_20085/g.29805  ORF Transcript_20085/g.29805 Transcript_20085/m.29805 type:complete len:619 (+) Transcript_20085:143-1999(+)